MKDLRSWTPRPTPRRETIAGRFVRLEPLDPVRHGDALFEAGAGPDAEALWRYLFEAPITRRDVFDAWAREAAATDDPLFFSVVDAASGRAEGRLALMRITPAHGVLEVGSILYGPRLARSRAATEAIYLLGRHVFEKLGYRRFEWKCDDRNEPSKRAALRFGFTFEGVFRKHMVVKGESRDTAWFGIVDEDWPRLARGYRAWLDPANFDAHGRQRESLTAFTTPA
ncbi:MAG: N-acetyltransferase [Salinarimonadaceae bacterium]|nr:MAG: N-acetyltransferase [Salinarimonadaceae bacterium]